MDLSDEELSRALEGRKAWIRSSDLVVPGVTTESMGLHYLIWLLRIGRVVIGDVDPLCGAVRISIRMDDLMEYRRERDERLRRS